jgi:hypothetical protein
MFPNLWNGRHAAVLTLLPLVFLAVPIVAQGQGKGENKLRVAVLALDLGETLPDGVVRACAKKVGPAVKADERKFAYIDAANTRSRLAAKSPALAGCLEKDCLKRTGKVLRASAGIKATVSGEAQIYDIEVEYFDLTTGERVHTEKSTCEICTATETGNLFGKTIQLGLRKVDVRRRSKKTARKKPKKPVEVTTKVSVKIHVMPPEGVVELGDLPLGTGTATTDLEPGSYTVRGRLEGFMTQEVPITVTSKSAPIEVYIQLAPEPEIITVAGSGGLEKSGGRVVSGWLLTVLGAGGVGVGSYLLWIDGQVTCSSGTFNQCPSVFETTAPGMAAFGVGLVSLTSGIFLLGINAVAGELAPDEPAARGLDLRVDPATGATVLMFESDF